MQVTNPALKQLLKLKKGVNFFNNLTDEEIAEIIFNIRFRKFATNEVLFKEGAKDNKELYFLLQGSVDIDILNHETLKQITVATLNKAMLFGEMRALIGEPRTATAKAGSDGAVLITFNIKESNEELAPLAFAKFYKNVSSILANKILSMNKAMDKK
ncbi:MAG: cyclic nucleotide-binding domain-containing protein [Campylobacterota bacterium]|nr:cyclic nucleotide-binding domain-containing protein [Campylobacterota bacterium]